jgi:mRNA interferase MazF
MADLGRPQGHEQAFKRPVVILQIDTLNYLNTVMVVPLTSRTDRGNSAIAVPVRPGEGGLDLPSVALCHQLRALDVRKLESHLGELPPDRLNEIEGVLAFVLGLPL